jgi:hypothetical protein
MIDVEKSMPPAPPLPAHVVRGNGNKPPESLVTVVVRAQDIVSVLRKLALSLEETGKNDQSEVMDFARRVDDLLADGIERIVAKKRRDLETVERLLGAQKK